jgi:manganese/zinc/iron transport system substrate-binding protein
MLSRRVVLTSLLSSVALAGLAPATYAGEKLSVVATTGMVGDAARVVGGDLIDVKTLMGAGVDPHGYRQTRSDIVAMSRADLVLWHGLYLEAQMEDFLADLSRKTPVVAVAEALPKDVLLAHEDYEGRFDPHVWMDPNLWSQVVDQVVLALTEVYPDGAAMFEANATGYKSELAGLARYTTDMLTQVPEDQRILLTAHDAFGYFGQSYGFEVMGIQGISTESEAGLSRISELVDLLVERNIGAVFVETSVSDRNIRALIEGAAARGHEVKIGGSLYSDAMGAEGTYEGTYLGMIDHNVTTISRALGADAPEGGRLGRLTAGT